jgi:PAS domain S-box-containing protein
MKDPSGANQELIAENSVLKQKLQELEHAEAKYKRCEEELLGKEETLRLCIEHSPAAIAMFDNEMKYIAASRRYRIDYRLDEQSLAGRSHYDVFPELQDRLKDIHRRCLSGSIEKADEDPFPRADGRLDYVRWEVRPWNKAGGEIGGIILFSEVITERKHAEEALIKSEEKFRKVFYTSPDSVNINRLEDGMYVSINPGFTRIMGYTEEEIIGKTSIEYNIWGNVEDRQRLVEGLKNEGAVTNLEATFRTKSGDIRYGLMSASVIELDGVPHIINITRDITDRKLAEKVLKESENQYRLLAENVNDVIFVLDMNLNYTYVSPSVKSLRGYEPEEILKQQSSIETLTPASWDLAMRGLSEVMALEGSGHREGPLFRTLPLEMTRKDGTTVWVEIKFSFIRDEAKKPVGILGVSRDITERKRAEKQLQDIIESLRKAFRATIQVMVSAVETRDPYTAGHQVRSADLARAIAGEMGLPQEKIDGIRLAGSVHDIGKLSVPAEILSKPTKLSEIEFSLIKEHPRKGYEILKDVESPWPLAEMVYQHHERMDGSGYPGNLKGDEILMEARILAVADVVEAMASHRPYRPALGMDAALNEIEKNSGIIYDNAVAEACLRLFREKGFQLEEA